MTFSRQSVLILAACFAIVLTHTAPADAVVRRSGQPLFLNRAAITVYYGAGLPVGDFSDESPGYGNHEEWAPDGAAEIEYFVSRTASIGFTAARTTYQDKTFPELETRLSTYGGFFRVVLPTATAVRPYLRAGIGGVEVQFQDNDTSADAEMETSFQVGGGLLWLPARWLGLSGQILYCFSDTDDAYIMENDTIVGFDTEYFVFAAGVSLFFP